MARYPFMARCCFMARSSSSSLSSPLSESQCSLYLYPYSVSEWRHFWSKKFCSTFCNWSISLPCCIPQQGTFILPHKTRVVLTTFDASRTDKMIFCPKNRRILPFKCKGIIFIFWGSSPYNIFFRKLLIQGLTFSHVTSVNISQTDIDQKHLRKSKATA